MKFTIKKLFTLLAMTGSLVITACTAKREADIQNEQQKEKIFAIAELDKKSFTMKTGDTVTSSDFTAKPQATNEKAMTKITQSTVPSRLQGLFLDRSVNGKTSAQYDIQINVDKSFVTVSKVVTDLSELTRLESLIAAKSKVKGLNGTQIVPFMKIKIDTYGVLQKAKNENKEETSNIELVPTDFKNATHIEISTKADAVTLIGQDTENKEALEEIYLSERLSGQVQTLDALKNTLQLKLSKPDSGLVYSVLEKNSDNDLELRVFRILKKSDLSAKQADLLKSKTLANEVLICPAAVLSQLSDEQKKDCVLVYSFNTKAEIVEPELASADDSGSESQKIIYKSTPDSTAGLIRISQNAPLVRQKEEALGTLDPSSTLRVVDIKGKEFLMRRTLEDGAATIAAFGPGTSGRMDIVQFELEAKRLVARRVLNYRGEKKEVRIDKEEVLSIPVTYKRRISNSQNLINEFENTTPEKAEYIDVDWTRNEIVANNSPMSMYDNGECVLSSASTTVSNVDMRMETGILNFSIEGSYNFQPECMSRRQTHDYGLNGAVQTSFNVLERVSFRLHDPTKEVESAEQIPTRAQNLLNYGVFTTTRFQEDTFGNIGMAETEIPLPMLHDFSNGKKLVYSLGGVPKDELQREIIIEGTKQVIADWNVTLRKVFNGTPLQTTEDMIILKIDGIDQEPGRLGDLDRNYIWNFEANQESSTLGVAQPAPNPRTGRIEQTNVLMYSGNLWSFIGSGAEMARIQKKYDDLKAEVLADYDRRQQLLEAAEKLAAEEAAKNDAAGESSIADESDPTTGDGSNEARWNSTRPVGNNPYSYLGKKWADDLTRKFITANRSENPAFSSQVLSSPSSALTILGLKTKGLSRIDNETIRAISESAKNSARPAYDEKRIDDRKQAFLKRIIQRATDEAILNDPMALQAVSAEEILKSYGSELSASEKNLLTLQIRRHNLMSNFNNRMNAGAGCVTSARPFASATANMFSRGLTLKEIYRASYMQTLAHEIGHTLGLTHNFKGSIDKANFKFKNEDTDRESSTVMEYFADDRDSYAGPGPYDVHALRTAYAGLVEIQVTPQMVASGEIRKDGDKLVLVKESKLKDNDGKPVIVKSTLNLANGSYEIPISDYKKIVLGDESWWKLDARKMLALPTKPYAYCNDRKVGYEPMCNRWDYGTTPFEVAKFTAEEYRRIYPIMNNVNNRVAFRRTNEDYISRILMYFNGLKLFKDEAFYGKIMGASEAYVDAYAAAALEGYKLFTEVVVTPHSSAPFYSKDRFKVVEYDAPVFDEKGQPVMESEEKIKSAPKKVVIESKAISNSYLPGSNTEVETRGIEIDKSIAITFLTRNQPTHERYVSAGIRFSFADFEKMMLSENPFVKNTNIMEILQSQQTGRPLSFVYDSDLGVQINLGGNWSLPVTDVMKYHNLLSSVVFLERDSSEDQYNDASQFYVTSSFKKPSKTKVFVAKADQPLTSNDTIKYWALDNAHIASDLVYNGAKARVIMDNKMKLASAWTALMASAQAGDVDNNKKVSDLIEKRLKELNANHLVISEEVAKAGQTLPKMMLQAFKTQVLLDEQIDEITAEAFKLIQAKDQKGVNSIIDQLEQSRAALRSMTLEIPFFAVVQTSMIQEAVRTENEAMKKYQSLSEEEFAKLTEADKKQRGLENLRFQVVQALLSPTDLEISHSAILSTVSELNNFLSITHPELSQR